jgi:tetratricopeptide (TPR) repeat protein
MRGALRTYYGSRKEDFFSILPVNPLPNETEAKGMYPIIDTAISKCKKVILEHSMPSAENMYSKQAEYNNWIDENWLLVGKSMYYRRDYEKALKNFQFVKQFFQKDPSTYEAELWIAKINIEQNKFADAKLTLDALNEISQEQKKKKFIDYVPFVKKKNNLQPGEEERPRMSRSLQYDIYKSYADLAVKRKDYEAAKEGLLFAISKCREKREKARLHFILAQIYQTDHQLDSAYFHYGKAIKASAAPEVAFNARMNRAITGTGEHMSRDLKRMLRDSKNAPFKDQIYYSMALVELNKNQHEQATIYLTKSTFYSGQNKRQKAMSYEKLGDISYQSKNYISAQKYYDSCSRFMPDDYPNGEEIKNKAIKLADLVKAVEIAIFEDSVQRIAKMSERDRADFIKETLKAIEAAEQKRKEQEAAKLLELQSQSNQNANVSGNKFVFNNPKLREDGYNDFRKLWGSRENEDDWRRSEKIVFNTSSADKKNSDSTQFEKTTTSTTNKLTEADLLKNVPLTDSAFAASQARLIEALYTSGVLYKEILNENELAAQQYEAILAMKKEGITDLSAAFQLYKINESSGNSEKYKSYILDKYPSSDAANYFRDPDFYIKQKQNQEAAGVAYLQLLDSYNRGNYQSVLTETNQIVETDKSNAYRAEYMLLNVLAAGQLTENKKELLTLLKRIIDEKPGTDQALRAKEMIDVINGGYSKNEAVNFNKTSIFKFDDKVPQFIIVMLDKEDDSEEAKNTISDFSKSFKKTRAKVSSKMTTTEQNFVLIQEFPTIAIASEYISYYKAGIDYLESLQDNKIFIITQENLKKLIETAKFDEYKLFYDDNY